MSLIRILILFLSLSSWAWARPEVSLAPETEVTDRVSLTWADVASVRGGSEELLRELAQIPWSKGDDLRTVIRERRTMSDIYARLDVKFTLPSKLNLKRVQGYSASEFRRKLMNHLSVLCADCTVEILSVQENRVQLASDWKIDESVLKITGSLLVPVNSSGQATAWIPVRLRVLRPGLVLRRSVLIGQKVAADDVETRSVDGSFARETPARLMDLNESAAARILSAGQVLYPSDLKKEDVVKRGQTVKLAMGNEDYEVSVNATAEENGRLGDVVKVKNTESGKSLSGVVTGTGQVRLQ